MEKSAIFMAIFMGLFGPLFTGISISIHRFKSQKNSPAQYFIASEKPSEVFESYKNYSEKNYSQKEYDFKNNNASFNITNKHLKKFPFSVKKSSRDFEFYDKSLYSKK